MTRALLVVDMQNGFCHPEGSFARIGMGLEGAAEAVRSAAAAVAQARRAELPVVFTRHLYRPGRADEGRALKQNSPALAGVDGLQSGTWDAEIVDELGCGPDDLTVDKVRFDAFQWTSLEPLLRGLGTGELVVCGVVTNICVETTVRSAFMRDFPVTLLADCCAAATRRLHELSLEVLSSYQLAEIASITQGYDVGAAPPPRSRPRPASAGPTRRSDRSHPQVPGRVESGRPYHPYFLYGTGSGACPRPPACVNDGTSGPRREGATGPGVRARPRDPRPGSGPRCATGRSGPAR
jgi:ureidoacrylate peracid hydrolase